MRHSPGCRLRAHVVRLGDYVAVSGDLWAIECRPVLGPPALERWAQASPSDRYRETISH
jgi:hypothetical protein